MVRQAHHDSGWMVIAAVALPLLSACTDISTTVETTMSGAFAPVKGAIDEVARRANEVGEGMNEVSSGIGRVTGALSGSGTTW